MDVDCLPFRDTHYFSELICDYLDQHEALRPFYNRFPNLDDFHSQILEKKENYTNENRKVLVKSLQQQYSAVEISEETASNITKLEKGHTFTVATGHQLNLFTGPLYFLYKIVTTIKLTQKLKETHPGHDFVPVYWMATEDHDFEEINYFNFKGKKIQWNNTATGAVGRFNTAGLNVVFSELEKTFGESDFGWALVKLFKDAYLNHENLAQATRYLANELFGGYGLVIVDGDDGALKQLLVPYIKKDVFEQLPFKEVSKSIEKLSKVSKDYSIQVNPREINYFYLKDGLRERIIGKDGKYVVNNSDLQFSKSELELEMEEHPERFSPNVIARPLYQEVILPNICYVGGGGELAYWLELKSYFDALQITFPMLLLRNSVLVMTKKQAEKVKKLNLDVSDLFLEQNQLVAKKVRMISDVKIDFSPQKQLLEEQFINLHELAQLTDKSFLGAVRAQEAKQKKGLDKLEKRLLKAQKRKLKDEVDRLATLQNELFPKQSLQERQLNFSEFYMEYGPEFIDWLLTALDPLKNQFLVLRY